MLDLSKIREEKLTYQSILKQVTEYDIYAYYLGNISIGGVRSSPFRKDDTPSFGIYLGNNGALMYNDYLLGSGGCIKFVQQMENCSFYEAMCIINERYNLGYPNKITKKSNYTHKPVITNTKIVDKVEKWIDIKVRPWEIYDKEYWSKYEISSGTLEFFNVYPVQRFWINNMLFNVDRLCYGYYYEPRVFKIYQPNKSDFKWISNIKHPELYQGHHQLPEKGEILFITSSLKDVMVLHEAGVNAVAPHTEHQILSDDLYQQYSKDWNAIIVFYDNDEAGITHANKMTEKFGLKSLVLPESDTKDPSDFVEKYDLETLKQWIKEKL